MKKTDQYIDQETEKTLRLLQQRLNVQAPDGFTGAVLNRLDAPPRRVWPVWQLAAALVLIAVNATTFVIWRHSQAAPQEAQLSLSETLADEYQINRQGYSAYE